MDYFHLYVISPVGIVYIPKIATLLENPANHAGNNVNKFEIDINIFSYKMSTFI